MTLNTLLQNNYPRLYEVAYRITGHKKNEAKDLITETYLDLYGSKTAIPTIEEDFIKFFAKCVKNRYIWIESNFNKQKKGPEQPLEFEYKEIIDVSEPCKECLVDEFISFKSSLPAHEKILVELHFENKLSCNMIAQELTSEFNFKVHPQSIKRMISPIKQKIKNKKWNNLFDL